MRVLYLSYDGLTDPLGRSQVLPYIEGLARLGHTFAIISCDKPALFDKEGDQLKAHLSTRGTTWHPKPYHAKPPILSTIYDIVRMARLAAQLHGDRPFDAVHCRSYPAALAGLWLKRRKGIKLVFDIRGFWADEKVDGLAWNRANPVYNAVYLFFKKMERVLLANSDAVISLTQAAKDEMLSWGAKGMTPDKIAVIPCCADTQHFDPARINQEQQEQLRIQLDLQATDLVLTYVGSLGSWYRLDDMLAFFKELRQQRPEAKFLFITQEDREIIDRKAAEASVPADSIRVFSATRENLPAALSLAQAGIFFRKAVYSALATSPTKLAEMLSMGLPVVTSPGIGDMESLSQQWDIGPVARTFTTAEYQRVISNLEGTLAQGKGHFREAAERFFALETGLSAYEQVYDSLASGNSARHSGPKE